MDGIKLTYQPLKGVYLKGMIGKQRHVCRRFGNGNEL